MLSAIVMVTVEHSLERSLSLEKYSNENQTLPLQASHYQLKQHTRHCSEKRRELTSVPKDVNAAIKRPFVGLLQVPKNSNHVQMLKQTAA